MNYSNTSSLSGITGTYVPVILGLGSNTKYNDMEPMDLLRSAIKFLGQKLTHLRYSSVYKTTAMYYENQPDFYNMAVFGFFSGSAIELLDYIQQIEAIHGRNRTNEIRNGPRPLDIDIELFGNEVFSSPRLLLPHPRLEERAFVLIPMLEIFPENAEVFNIGKDYYQNCLNNLPEQKVCRLSVSL